MPRTLFVVALGLGLAIAYVDSRPNWDDTGVTAAALLLVCGTLGALAPKQPWMWALAVGLWIPVFGVARSQNYGSLLALAVGFAGAYVGMALRKISIRAS